MKAKLNQEKMEVTITWNPENTETVSYVDFYARAFAIQRLHYNGQFNNIITDAEWEQAYLMCDGFGLVDKYFAISMCWDWSHVRDSSYETLRKVADWIASNHWILRNIEVIAKQSFEDCNRCGIDPIMGVPSEMK